MCTHSLIPYTPSTNTFEHGFVDDASESARMLESVSVAVRGIDWRPRRLDRRLRECDSHDRLSFGCTCASIGEYARGRTGCVRARVARRAYIALVRVAFTVLRTRL
jgi:hypothetical protein